MEHGRLLTSAEVGAALGLSEATARAALRRYAPVGTMRTNDGRWLLPVECLGQLRRALQ